ncbi:hypothetical protein [Gracilibacillus alcaliphilus]
MLSRKVKLKSLYVFMTMILLLGLLHPGLVFAAGSANTEEDNAEETPVEEIEESVEAEAPEETEGSTEDIEESFEAEESVEEVAEPAETEENVEESVESVETGENTEEAAESDGTEEKTEEAELQPTVFEVNTVLDITEETEGLVTISVDTTSDVEITSLKWLEGNRTVEDFDGAGHGIDLETASFTVEENGTYTVYASNAKGVEAVSTIMVDNIVEPDPEPEIDFDLYVEPGTISEWDSARRGVQIFAYDLPPNAEVQLIIPGTDIDMMLIANSDGNLGGNLTFEAAAGTYSVTLTLGDVSKTADIVVQSNEDYYTYTLESSVHTEKEVITESEATAEFLTVTGRDFPSMEYIDIILNGDHIETIEGGGFIFSHDLDISQLPIGTHTVEFVHPAGSGEASFTIVPDEQGTFPPAGTYEGKTHQTIAGGIEFDEPSEYEVALTVDENGILTQFETEYFWFCSAPGEGGTSSFSITAETPITADQPFEIKIGSNTLTGTVHADGTASGTGYVGSECGASIFEWSAELDGAVDPEPQPEEFEVELTPDTTEETEGAVTITVTTTSDVELTSLKWLAGDRTAEDFVDAGNEIDLETMTFTVEENGIYTIYALNADGVVTLSTIEINNITDSGDGDGTDPGDGDGTDPGDGDGTDPGDGDGTDPGDGDGTDPGDGDGTDPGDGDGTDPGDGDGTDPGDGDGTDPGDGDGTDPGDGDGTDPGDGDGTDPGDGDGTDPGDGDDSDSEDNTLPYTSTHLFSLLAIGTAILFIGLALLMFRRKQNA